MLYKQVIDTLIDVFSRFKGVHCVKYIGEDLFNTNGNNRPIQVYIDNVSLHQYNLTTNIVKAQYDIYIMDKTDYKHDVLQVQDKCYNLALNCLAMLDKMEEIRSYMSVIDWSILTFRKMTDDDFSGVKLTLMLNIPNGVDLCALDDYFNDEPYKEPQDQDIDIDIKEVGHLDINPINLPISNNPCNR